MGAVLGRPTVIVGRYYDPGTGQFLNVDPEPPPIPLGREPLNPI